MDQRPHDGPPLPSMIPPGSTAQRELLRAIGDALSSPLEQTRSVTFGACDCLMSERSFVTVAVGRILRDPESDDDAMSEARTLRDVVVDCPPDYSQHRPGN
jgi:hypothetical protein